MRTSKIVIVMSAFLLMLPLTGCIGVNRQFSEMKDKIMGEFKNEYRTEYQFSVGSSAITISSWFIDFAAEEEYVDDMVREISSVQVGIYNRVNGSDAEANFATLQSIDEEMKNKGWKYIMRTTNNEEITGVYLSEVPGEILDKMFIFHLSDAKLVIIEVNGDLKKVISYAIEDRNFHFDI